MSRFHDRVGVALSNKRNGTKENGLKGKSSPWKRDRRGIISLSKYSFTTEHSCIRKFGTNSRERRFCHRPRVTRDNEWGDVSEEKHECWRKKRRERREKQGMLIDVLLTATENHYTRVFPGRQPPSSLSTRLSFTIGLARGKIVNARRRDGSFQSR